MLFPQFHSPISGIPRNFAKLTSALALENRKSLKNKIHEWCVLAQVKMYLCAQLIWNVISKTKLRKGYTMVKKKQVKADW